MAKRRRLTAPHPAGPSNVATFPPGAPPARRPPIAEVAGEAAATSALQDMADRFDRARAEGRMIQSLPLDAIETDYLIRDRLGLEEEGQGALVASIRARGQQMPVEVVDLGAGRYGLISGWRRLAALRALHAETGEDRFATALAVLRRPADAPEAYLAMVEENEIRVGLSYYERARIAARAVEAGVFAGDTEALQALFAAASRARRSKIGSFLRIVRALDGGLRFPAAIPERLGLALSAALEADAGLAGRILADLRRNPPATAEEERARLARLAAPPRAGRSAEAAPDQMADKVTDRMAGKAPGNGTAGQGGAGQGGAGQGVRPPPLAAPPVVTFEPERDRITLTGPGISASLARRLRDWLADGQG